MRALFLLLTLVLHSRVVAQTPQHKYLQFDKPIYTAGEDIWFAFYRTDTGITENRMEILHYELISPRNVMIAKGKLAIQGRLASGNIQLASNLEEGYYRFRAFTLHDLVTGRDYISADIPVYSEWKENLTVFRFEDELIGEVKIEQDVERNRRRQSFNRRDSLHLSDLMEIDQYSQFIFWVLPIDFRDFTPIVPEVRKVPNPVKLNSDLDIEDSLYFEAFLSDQESGNGVSSNLISVFSGTDKKFYRSKAVDGWMNLKLPGYNGEFTLQVFNLNPYQDAVNDLRIRTWTINEGYFNPAKPPLTKEIADYLIKARKRRKIHDLFSSSGNGNGSTIIFLDTGRVVPDLRFVMADYRYLNNLKEFIFEAIPGARIVKMDDGSESVRLYNPERRSIFVDRPWYIVDGYLTSREEEVLKIPFNDIEEIRLYVDTRTIKENFEYFLWRNGILEVKTNDIRHVRSLKSDPNYTDYTGLTNVLDFNMSLNGRLLSPDPDFRTTIYWKTGTLKEPGEDIHFQLSDDTGRFLYNLIEIFPAGELSRKVGEFEVR